MVKKDFFEYDDRTKIRILPSKNSGGMMGKGIYWTKIKTKNELRKDKIKNILDGKINL